MQLTYPASIHDSIPQVPRAARENTACQKLRCDSRHTASPEGSPGSVASPALYPFTSPAVLNYMDVFTARETAAMSRTAFRNFERRITRLLQLPGPCTFLSEVSIHTYKSHILNNWKVFTDASSRLRWEGVSKIFLLTYA